MSIQDQAIGQFRSRIATLLIIRNSLAALAVWAFLAGTAVLALRAALGVSPLPLLWLLASAPLALVPAVWLALRRVPTPVAVRAVLDRHSSCGGLLMAGAEVPLGTWREDLPEINQPRLRWRSARAWGLLAGGLAFLALGFLLPQSFTELGQHQGLEVSRETAKLAKQLDVLKEESLMEPKRADDLKSKLEQIRREALGKDPVKTLESLDHLKDVLSKTAKEAAESAARKNENLGRAETLAETLKKKPKNLDAKAMAEGMSQLATLSRQAAAENEMLNQGLDPETLDALKINSLTPDKTINLPGLEGERDAVDRSGGAEVLVQVVDLNAHVALPFACGTETQGHG